MQKSLCILLLLSACVYGYDHSVFKNCSEVELCQDLREATPEQNNILKANLSTLFIDETGSALVELVDENQRKIKLKLQLLHGNKFRAVLEEPDSQRYHLKDVLNDDPEIKNFSYVKVESNSATLSEDDELPARIVIRNSPLVIEFYNEQTLVTQLDGERIIFREDQSFAFQVTFPKATKLYGIHQHIDNLSLKNTEESDPYRVKNLDVSDYELYSKLSVYGAVPLLYGHGLNTTAAVFLHNAAELWIDLNKTETAGSSAYFMVESGALDLFVLLGPTPKEVLRQYTNLTGVAHLPQLWALGYHQSRWNYVSQDDVKNVVANFDTYDFPLDAIWLDIEYTDGKRYFTWDPKQFSDPVEMQRNLSVTNRKLVTIIDPHIKVDPDYNVYSGALEKDLFIKNPNGTVFEGDCWPGKSSYIDFLNPEAQEYYASFYHYDKFVGSTETLAGIWNDMNEPTVFDYSREKTMPGDLVHQDEVLHKNIHNIYGLLHTKSTHLGLMQRDNEKKRPFILTRSHFAGSQRYAFIWTGDNEAEWGYLALSYPGCLNANLMGFVFCGADIGGFKKNPDEQLIQRWYQAGAWLPFYRSHSSSDTNRREPYLFSSEVQEVIREAMYLRYKHIPVWYTLFFEHTQTGDPILRPLFYEYPSDPSGLEVDSQVLIGSNILAKAVSEPDVNSVEVYLPGEDNLWYQVLGNSAVYAGAQVKKIDVNITFIPIFYKSGSIITLKDNKRQSTEDMKEDAFTIVINLDQNNEARGRLYVDDYVSFEYQNYHYNYFEMVYSNSNLTISPIGGDDDNQIRIKKIIINNRTEIDSERYQQTIYSKSQDEVIEDIQIKTKAPTVISLFS